METTSKIANITPADVKVIMEMVAGENALGNVREPSWNGAWVTNGTVYCALSLSAECWDIVPGHYKENKDVKVTPKDGWGAMQGKVFVEGVRSEVMAAVGQMVDMNVAKASYGKLIADRHEVIRIGTRYVKVCILDHAVRCMVLAGMEFADVYVNEQNDQVRFVAYHDGKVAAIVTCCAIREWKEVASRFPLFGTLSIMGIEAPAVIVPENIRPNINAYHAFDEQAEQDAYDTRRVFAVRISMSHTYYVLANTEKEAEGIAMENADSDDFDDGFETDEVEESDIEEADSDGHLYDKDGEVDIDEYMATLDDDDEDDEED